jgi:hypothetical protein
LYPIDGRWYLAQRYAIDFNQLDAENRPGTGDPTLPTSFCQHDRAATTLCSTR